MTKYSFVLLAGRRDEFLAQLQAAGVVDVSAAEVEATREQRELMVQIDRYTALIERSRALAKAQEKQAREKAKMEPKQARKQAKAQPYSSGEQAFEAFNEATAEIGRLNGELVQLNNEFAQSRLWGSFSHESVEKLAQAGVNIKLYSLYSSDWAKFESESAKGGDILVEKIAENDGRTYFVVVGEAVIEAQEHKIPERTTREIEAAINRTESEIEAQRQTLNSVAASVERLQISRAELLDKLSFSQAQTGAATAAEESLTIVEGWCPAEIELPEFAGVYTLQSAPEAEDDVPIELRNSRFMDAFRFVGDFYALPKYGTADLTPYFSLFYMLFFGFCMGDAGYGAILMAGYFVLRGRKSMARVARLTLYCGAASVVFGCLTGSLFGVSMGDWAPLTGIKFLSSDSLFYLALGLGIVQIIFGMILNIANIVRQQGFLYSLGRIGWLIVMVSTGAAMALGAMASTWYLVAMGVGMAGMFILNNPKRNPLINIGAGLWNTYNDLTGLLGDILSYIRLFALCLSGGTLALVFNNLVMGITGSLPLVVGVLIAAILLLFLHGINIFMAVIGSFVHPMRLTFVEFYKNAGFEAANRAYKPFKVQGLDCGSSPQ